MRISVHSFVLRVDGRNILIDTCCGNDKTRSLPPVNMQHWPYLENLARAGLRPEDIDLVMCTHLHFDHVGWNTRLKDGSWVPTFPNARYLFGRRDLEFFSKQRHEALHREAFDDSVAPILDAGWLISSIPIRAVHREIGDGIWLEDVSGHSPGNLCVIAECGGESCDILGRLLSPSGPNGSAGCSVLRGRGSVTSERYAAASPRAICQRRRDILPGAFHGRDCRAGRARRRRSAEIPVPADLRLLVAIEGSPGATRITSCRSRSGRRASSSCRRRWKPMSAPSANMGVK